MQERNLKGLDQIKKAVDKRDELLTHALKIFETLDREIFEFEPSLQFMPNRKCLFETFFKIMEHKMEPVVGFLYSSLEMLDPQVSFTKNMLSKDMKNMIFLKIQQSLRAFYDDRERKAFKEWENGQTQ